MVNDGDLAQSATLSCSSTLKLVELSADGPWLDLKYPVAQMLPLTPVDRPTVALKLRSKVAGELRVALRVSEKASNFTPDQTLCEQTFSLVKGEQTVEFLITNGVDVDCYGFLCLYGAEGIEVICSEERVTGLMTVWKKFNHAVSNTGEQVPPEGIGIDRFEFWVPDRRPAGHNLAFRLSSPLKAYELGNVTNGSFRPVTASNAWVADWSDASPRLELTWDRAQTISEIALHFDTDFDHAMETAQWGHPEDVMPFCLREYVIRDADGQELHRATGNYQTLNRIQFDEPVCTSALTIEFAHPSEKVPAALFGVCVY